MQNTLLNQFGAVFTYAIELERLLSEFYKNAAIDVKNEKNMEELNLRSKASQKRMKKLERSRRENVTEITLEPIEGLDKENYVLELTQYTSDIIKKNEEIAAKFYADAGPKINVLESRRLFKRCYKEHSNLKSLE